MTTSDYTIPMRTGEVLDQDLLEPFLRQSLDDLPPDPLVIRQFPTGASNLTYLLTIGDWQAVLRRPPHGPVPPRAHDMVREARLLELLHPVYPLAPRPYLIQADPEPLGVPFSVLEYRRGVVIDRGLPPGVESTRERCRWIAEAVVETLADLHAIDYLAAGMGKIGRPDGFLARQVEGWIGRYERAKTDEIPAAASLMERIRENVPDSPPPTVIHNDYKLNNLLFDFEAPRITAVLDWEMATVGDPLLDLAIFLSYWSDPNDPPELKGGVSKAPPLPGMPSRAELQAMYAERTGRDLSSMAWYLPFAYFKLAVILQQIYARWVRGQTQDPRFGSFGTSVRTLIEHANRMADGNDRSG